MRASSVRVTCPDMTAPVNQPRTRSHGTRAAYVFGVAPGTGRGCRCPACTEANRDYQRARDRANRRPDERRDPAYVDAGEAREHLLWLSGQGLGLRTVAARARVSRSTLVALRDGERQRCTPGVADRILAVGLHRAAPGCRVDAAATWRLLDDMIAHGHTRTAIARMLGSAANVPSLQLRRDRISAANARKVDEIYRNVMSDVLAKRERDRLAQRAARERRTGTVRGSASSDRDGPGDGPRSPGGRTGSC